jgi:hypothetical protein
MASPPPEIAVPVREEEDMQLEEGDAFDIPSKNASYDRLRRWRVCHPHFLSHCCFWFKFLLGIIVFWGAKLGWNCRTLEGKKKSVKTTMYIMVYFT